MPNFWEHLIDRTLPVAASGLAKDLTKVKLDGTGTWLINSESDSD